MIKSKVTMIEVTRAQIETRKAIQGTIVALTETVMVTIENRKVLTGNIITRIATILALFGKARTMDFLTTIGLLAVTIEVLAVTTEVLVVTTEVQAVIIGVLIVTTEGLTVNTEVLTVKTEVLIVITRVLIVTKEVLVGTTRVPTVNTEVLIVFLTVTAEKTICVLTVIIIDTSEVVTEAVTRKGGEISSTNKHPPIADTTQLDVLPGILTKIDEVLRTWIEDGEEEVVDHLLPEERTTDL